MRRLWGAAGLLTIVGIAAVIALEAPLPALGKIPAIPQASGQASSQDSGTLPDAASWVQYTGPATLTIAAKKPQILSLKLHIADGLHINSHTPKDKIQIPTNLAVVESSSLRVSGVDFPPGVPFAFSFDPETKLDVYTGDITLTAHVFAPRAGSHSLSMLLRYQACDNRACYPPKKIPIEITVEAN